MEPVQNAVWFAGEAAHETLWGTVGGAWESGERAADAVLHRLGPLKEPERRARAAAHVEGRCAAAELSGPALVREVRR